MNQNSVASRIPGVSVHSINNVYGDGRYENIETHLRQKRRSQQNRGGASQKQRGDTSSRMQDSDNGSHIPHIDSGSVSLMQNGVPIPRIKRDLNNSVVGTNAAQSVPLSPTGKELLFLIFREVYERKARRKVNHSAALNMSLQDHPNPSDTLN